ncbi:MAG: hypothetical protein JNL39_20785 [Opitutaceae bacterium]|nr:hypothetical protein [Opitutaceae bacterium]
MNNEEAKFILSAYRPDGRDASDPRFAEALAQAARDPELRRWLEGQRAFDRAVAARIADLAPPAGLREAILAGARASQPRRAWWAQPGWIAAAAAVVLLAAAGLRWAVPAEESLAGFAAFAAADSSDEHDRHDGFPAGLGEVQARLASQTAPFGQTMPVSLEDLRRSRCRTLRVAGRDVFELCFNRDGTWYHLYVGERGKIPPGAGGPALASKDGYSAAAWTDARHVYALVAHAEPAALRRLI